MDLVRKDLFCSIRQVAGTTKTSKTDARCLTNKKKKNIYISYEFLTLFYTLYTYQIIAFAYDFRICHFAFSEDSD